MSSQELVVSPAPRVRRTVALRSAGAFSVELDDEPLVVYLRARVADLQRTIFEQQNRIDELEFQIRSAQLSDVKDTSIGVDVATEMHEVHEENDMNQISAAATVDDEFSATTETEFDDQTDAFTKCGGRDESSELNDEIESKELCAVTTKRQSRTTVKALRVLVINKKSIPCDNTSTEDFLAKRTNFIRVTTRNAAALRHLLPSSTCYNRRGNLNVLHGGYSYNVRRLQWRKGDGSVRVFCTCPYAKSAIRCRASLSMLGDNELLRLQHNGMSQKSDLVHRVRTLATEERNLSASAIAHRAMEEILSTVDGKELRCDLSMPTMQALIHVAKRARNGVSQKK